MIGINNAGKPSALRCFYEFRGLFATLACIDQDTVVRHLNSSTPVLPWAQPPSVTDLTEMFSETEASDLHISIEGFGELGRPVPGASQANLMHLSVTRGSSTLRLLDLAAARGVSFRGRQVVPQPILIP